MPDPGPQVLLGRRTLHPRSPPYVIAEIGVNHEGSLTQAMRLIELAAEGGADAAKFQSYTADTLASRDSPAYWDTTKEPTSSQHELFEKYSNFGEDEYVELAGHCSAVGIDFLCTPFDDRSVEFIEPLVPAYKVASADLTNLPFLGRIASKGKPVVLSTGASTLVEIDLAVDTLILCGTTTSGCVRATAVEASNYNFHTAVVEEGTFDRFEISHKVSLMDVNAKYGRVLSLGDALEYLKTGAEPSLTR